MLDADLESLADTWDYQWTLARYALGGLAVVPARNLSTNVGFGAYVTHTVHPDELAASTLTVLLAPPFSGPAEPVADDDLDRELLRFERLRSLREAMVPTLLARAMTDPRVRARFAPNPAVANALAALDDPAAAADPVARRRAPGCRHRPRPADRRSSSASRRRRGRRSP